MGETTDLPAGSGDSGESFARNLSEALILAAETGEIAAPVRHDEFLEMIVATAMDVIGATAGSLLSVDHEQGDLVFEVALGDNANKVKRERVPLGHGIAGLVAVTGQPMAVAHADSPSSQQATDIAQRAGYVPKAILCIPLFHHDIVTGVIELLDKRDGTVFGPGDIASLGLFARQAAIAIEQSRTHQHLPRLVAEILRSLTCLSSERRAALHAGIQSYTTGLHEDIRYRRALELSRLVHEIAMAGESEYAACRTILSGFAEYVRTRDAETGGMQLNTTPPVTQGMP